MILKYCEFLGILNIELRLKLVNRCHFLICYLMFRDEPISTVSQPCSEKINFFVVYLARLLFYGILVRQKVLNHCQLRK